MELKTLRTSINKRVKRNLDEISTSYISLTISKYFPSDWVLIKHHRITISMGVLMEEFLDTANNDIVVRFSPEFYKCLTSTNNMWACRVKSDDIWFSSSIAKPHFFDDLDKFLEIVKEHAKLVNE